MRRLAAGAATISLVLSGQVQRPLDCSAHAARPVDPELGDAPIPDDLLQEQNYPNPFDPATTVQFSLAHMAFVDLRSCRPVDNGATPLISHIESPGIHASTFSAQGLAARRSFSLLRSGDFIQAPVMTDVEQGSRRAIKKGTQEHESDH